MLESVSDIKKQFIGAGSKLAESQPGIDIVTFVANLKKDSKFKNFTDEQLQEYAHTIIAKRVYQSLKLSLKLALPSNGQPNDPMWSQYSAEEIIAMEEIGVLVPQEFLDWAHSINDSDTVLYEITSATEDENSFENLDVQDNDLVKSDITKKTQKLLSKAISEKQLLKEVVEDTIPMSNNLEKKQADIMKTQNLSVGKIEGMQKEFTKLDDKIKAGDELSAVDYSRYKELGTILSGNNNDNISSEIKAINSDIDELVEQMDLMSNLININDKIEIELDDMTRRLAPMEAGRNKKFLPNQKFNMVSNLTANLYYSSLGNKLSLDATLLNDNIGFDTIDVQNKINTGALDDNVLSGKTVEGDGSQPQVQGEENSAESNEAQEENSKNSEMNSFEKAQSSAMGTIEKVKIAGSTSKQYGQDALKEAGLVAKEEEKIEEEQAELETKTEEVEDVTQAGEVIKDTPVEDAPETPEAVSEDKTDEVNQEINILNLELANINEEGLTIEEKFQRYLQNNDKFKNLNSEAEDSMVKTNLCGNAATVLGAITITEGVELIAFASSIAWIQPALAALLIGVGTSVIKLGTNFVETGVELIATSVMGFDACKKTDKQIKESDKNIEKATKKIKKEDTSENGSEKEDGKTVEGDGSVVGENSKKSGEEKKDIGEDDANEVEDQGKNITKSGQESKKLAEKNLKDKAKVDKEIKNTEKSLKAEAKRIKKMTVESQKMNRQIEQMNSEALEIQSQQMQQNNASIIPAPTGSGVGLQSNSSIATSSNNDNSVQNSARLQSISNKTGQLEKRITKNISSITKIERTSQKQVKKLNKNYKIKQSIAQNEIKQQQEKDAKAEKFQGTVTKVGYAFTGVKIAGQIMSKILTPPWVAAAGEVMFLVGKYGEISCYLTNAAVDAARGDFLGAAINIGAAALSFVSGPIKLESAGAAVGEAAKLGAKEVAKEGVTEVAKETATEVAKETATEVAKETATEVAKETATEIAKETATGTVKDLTLTAGQAGLSYLQGVHDAKEAQQDDGQVKEKNNRKIISFQEKKARKTKLRKIQKSNRAALRK